MGWTDLEVEHVADPEELEGEEHVDQDQQGVILVVRGVVAVVGRQQQVHRVLETQKGSQDQGPGTHRSQLDVRSCLCTTCTSLHA